MERCTVCISGDKAIQYVELQLGTFDGIEDAQPYIDYIWFHLMLTRREKQPASYWKIVEWITGHPRRNWKDSDFIQMLSCSDEILAQGDSSTPCAVFDDLAMTLRRAHAIDDRAAIEIRANILAATLSAAQSRDSVADKPYSVLDNSMRHTKVHVNGGASAGPQPQAATSMASSNKRSDLVDFSAPMLTCCTELLTRTRPRWSDTQRAFTATSVSIAARQITHGRYLGPTLDEIENWARTFIAARMPDDAADERQLIGATVTMQYMLFLAMNPSIPSSAADGSHVEQVAAIRAFYDEAQSAIEDKESRPMQLAAIAGAFDKARATLDGMIEDPFRRGFFTPMDTQAFVAWREKSRSMLQEIVGVMRVNIVQAQEKWQAEAMASIARGCTDIDYYGDRLQMGIAHTYESYVIDATGQVVLQFAVKHLPEYDDRMQLPFLRLSGQHLTYEPLVGIVVDIEPEYQ